MKYIAKTRFRFGQSKKLYEVGDIVEVPKYYVEAFLGHGMIEIIEKKDKHVEEPRGGLNEEWKRIARKPKHKTNNDYTKKKKKK